MKIQNKLFIALLFTSWHLLAQPGRDTLRMDVTFGGIRFYQGSRLLRPAEVLRVMESTPAAMARFKKAKVNNDAAQVIGFVGGFMIGWPLGMAIAGGDPQWGLAAGGLAVALLSLPFSKAFASGARQAINLYNGKSTAMGASVRLVPALTGGSIVVKF